MIYKLKVWTSDSEKNTKFKDLYFEVERIAGFYVPDKTEDEDDNYKTINVIHAGGLMTIVQEPHILKYLRKNFVDLAINE